MAGVGGLSLLHQAVLCGSDRAAAILIEAGADVDCRNREGHAPLHFVCVGTREHDGPGGARALMMLLLRNGADPKAQTNKVAVSDGYDDDDGRRIRTLGERGDKCAKDECAKDAAPCRAEYESSARPLRACCRTTTARA